MSTTPDEEIWTRRPGEPTRAFAMFRAYLEMPAKKRSLARLADMVRLSRSQLARYSSDWNWVARVDAWTDAVAVQADLRRLETLDLIERSVRDEVEAMRDEPVSAEPMTRNQRILALRRARLAAGVADASPDEMTQRISLDALDALLASDDAEREDGEDG